MGWLLLLIVVTGFAWEVVRGRRSRDGPGQVVSAPRMTLPPPQHEPGEWAREREQRLQTHRAAVDRIRASFVPPRDLAAALAGIEAALSHFSRSIGAPVPHLEALRAEMVGAGLPKKQEAAVRKRISEAYKLRADAAKLVEALAWCILHVVLCVEHGNPEWKSTNFIKRLANNFDYKTYREQCLGFLIAASVALRVSRPDLSLVCDECVERLFSSWQYDLDAARTYEEDLRRLAQATSASDKHFIINGLVDYLARGRRFDPAARAKLVDLAEQDVAIYKTFLTAFTPLEGKTNATFAMAVRSQHYMCPNLPSFIALWDLYEEEHDVAQLLRLRKIASEIKYSQFENAEVDEEPVHQTSAAAPPIATSQASFPTELIEVAKSGKKGKLAFLDGAGAACSTEEAAQDYFRRSGHKVLRGEVQFWQAMFGLAFWEEIFEGTGAPNAFNDIPVDLFSGKQFYDARRARIELKAAAIARSDVRHFMLGQLQRWGTTWTRIVFDGGRGEFGYRAFLESAEVAEFLSVIDPTVFAKIVHRIASNPNENRSGLPDYMIWKDGAVSFIEVKGVREQIRDSQSSWLEWMHAEGIAVRVVRVKGT